jgi:catechol 2,3-dioxygenase-like lactoylglutathione lyase family enzyme
VNAAHQLRATLGSPVQIAYAVPDAEAAAERWASELGVGPFFVRSHIPVVDVVHRGQPANFDHTSAYAQWGAAMVELVQDHGDGPSAIRDMYGPAESGLHHLAFIVPDLDLAVRHLLDLGYSLAQSARTAGGIVFHFVDAVARLGHMLELYERDQRLLEFYAEVRTAADGWDGRDPIRRI